MLDRDDPQPEPSVHEQGHDEDVPRSREQRREAWIRLGVEPGRELRPSFVPGPLRDQVAPRRQVRRVAGPR
jgi:hypothetical protein